MSFWIVSDVASDLPRSYYEKVEKFTLLPMPFRMNGKDFLYKSGDEAALKSFYASLRDGQMATTAQVSTTAYLDIFRELLEKGEEILCITFSSGLSGTYQAAVLAQKMILEEKPGAKVVVLDSLCASLGQGLYLHYAIEKRNSGKSIDETTKWLMDNRQNVNMWFTVDDLDFLRRGGRVSATSAYLGSMLKIKPVLHVNFEGKLIPREKVQGRKRALKNLAEKVITLAKPKEGQVIFISHGDCLEDAEYTITWLKEAGFNAKDILFAPLGAIIGAHAGPGTVAVFFMGEGR